MARAGDGAPRAATRQRTRILRVRVTPAEEDRIEAATRRDGYRSVADFLRARALQAPSARDVPPLVIGELGTVGGTLTQAADLLHEAGRKNEALRCRNASQRLAWLLRRLMEG